VEPSDIAAHRRHVSGQLMPEQCRRADHLGVIAPPEHFDVGSASERRADPYQYIAAAQLRDVHSLDAELLLAIKHGRAHPVRV
jgi:hypothetical protein